MLTLELKPFSDMFLNSEKCLGITNVFFIKPYIIALSSISHHRPPHTYATQHDLLVFSLKTQACYALETSPLPLLSVTLFFQIA